MLKMQIIGNLGKDCIVNNVNGKNVINFTVAHTEKYRDSQGNNQEKTTWVECAWWIDRTTISQYLTKGKQVYAEGTPEVRSFTRNDGSNGASLSMRVRELQLLGGNANRDNMPTNSGSSNASSYNHGNSYSTGNTQNAGDMDEPIDDLPF